MVVFYATVLGLASAVVSLDDHMSTRAIDDDGGSGIGDGGRSCSRRWRSGYPGVRRGSSYQGRGLHEDDDVDLVWG